ncbi:SRPBCC family protein [Pseudarthrobacter phenanthrenivorans]|uniref:SRPBCC family protein n=1 Tax=Pseudarthrobacter phenanthrenivorans TaxID=361575 RepID=UPI002F351CF2
MAHAENEITISRSPEDVYAFLADGLNNRKWRAGVQSISLKSGAAGAVGSVYRQTLSGPGGRAIDGDYEITTAEPGRLLAFQVVAGPARPSGEYHFGQLPEGTRVRFTLDLQPKGLMKIMGPMVQRTMDAEVAQLARLKAVLEG